MEGKGREAKEEKRRIENIVGEKTEDDSNELYAQLPSEVKLKPYILSKQILFTAYHQAMKMYCIAFVISYGYQVIGYAKKLMIIFKLPQTRWMMTMITTETIAR